MKRSGLVILVTVAACSDAATSQGMMDALAAPDVPFGVLADARTLPDANGPVKEGLVREINFGDGASRYDGVTERHDHAICTKCGKLVDFDLTETADLLRAAARKSRFKPESVHLTLMGVCPDCREATQ